MRLIKLTTKNGMTKDYTKWGPGVTNKPAYRQPRLCTGGVIHAYLHELQAILWHDEHVGSDFNTVWEARGDVVVQDGEKVGTFSLTTTKRLGSLKELSGGYSTITKAFLGAAIYLQEHPIGHPRTGSKPIQAFKKELATTNFKDLSKLSKLAQAIPNGVYRERANKLVGELASCRYWIPSPRGSAAKQQAVYAQAYRWLLQYRGKAGNVQTAK